MQLRHKVVEWNSKSTKRPVRIMAISFQIIKISVLWLTFTMHSDLTFHILFTLLFVSGISPFQSNHQKFYSGLLSSPVLGFAVGLLHPCLQVKGKSCLHQWVGGNHPFKNITNTAHFFNSKLLKVSLLQPNPRFVNRPFHSSFKCNKRGEVEQLTIMDCERLWTAACLTCLT